MPQNLKQIEHAPGCPQWPPRNCTCNYAERLRQLSEAWNQIQNLEAQIEIHEQMAERVSKKLRSQLDRAVEQYKKLT